MSGTRITLSLAGLALGTALATTGAFAQNYSGKGANDGGLTTVQAQKGAERTGSASNREAFRSGNETYPFGGQSQPPRKAPGAFGKGLYAYSGQNDFNGPGQPPVFKYNSPSTGRAANDGGLATVQAQKGAERTGSTSNREAFRSGQETYSFGAQGQPPKKAPDSYGQ
jgi:hypothetical protein